MIKNELTRKRFKRFCAIRRSVYSVWIILFLIFISATAEIWANNRPLVMRFEGAYYFPVVTSHYPTEFGQEGVITDYRKINWEEKGNWALWPLVRWNPFESNEALETYPSAPSGQNWFGTDDRGRDVLARLIYGFRYSLGFAVLVWFFSFLVGTIGGALMGYRGGRMDLYGQRVVEVFDALPYLLMLLTLIAFMGASLGLLVVFSVFLGWMRISTYMRAEFLKLRKREFVEAAKAQGVGTTRILFRHILPNGLGPLITFSPAEIASNIYTLAILDYLGMGLPPPAFNSSLPFPPYNELLIEVRFENRSSPSLP